MDRQFIINCILDAMVCAEYQDEQWKDYDTAVVAAEKIMGNSPIEWINGIMPNKLRSES